MRVLLAVPNPLVREGITHVVRETTPASEVVAVDKRALHAAAHAGPFAAALIAYPWVPLAALGALRPRAPHAALIVIVDDVSAPILRKPACAHVAAIVPTGASPAIVSAVLRLALAGDVTVFGSAWVVESPQQRPARRRASRRSLSLTPRQLDVMALLARGKPNQAIAAELGIGLRTVKGHVAVILRALDVDNRVDAGHVARRWLAQREGTGLVHSEIAIR